MNIKSLAEKTVPKKVYFFAHGIKESFIFARSYNRLNHIYNSKPRKHQKIRIVFIVQRVEVFSSVQTVFETAIKNPNCDVYLLPIHRKMLIDEETNIESYKAVIDFCKAKHSGTVIESYNETTQSYVDLKEIEPDYIFLNVPYTEVYPKEYGMAQLSALAKVCYIPYGFSATNETRFRKLYNLCFSSELLRNVSFFFADGNVTYAYVKKRIKFAEFLYGRRLYNIGYTRFDNINCTNNVPEYNHTMLWLPRWTAEKQVENGNLGSCFFKYKDKLVEYVSNLQDDAKLIIRPHPLAFANFLISGMMSAEQIERYKKAIEESDKISLDEQSSYQNSFAESGILIADYSSIIIEFFILGKPIIYCGDYSDLSPQLGYVIDTFYYACNWDEVKHTLDMLLSGNDPLAEKRNKALERFKEQSCNAGEKILNVLLQDYKKWKG